MYEQIPVAPHARDFVLIALHNYKTTKIGSIPTIWVLVDLHMPLHAKISRQLIIQGSRERATLLVRLGNQGIKGYGQKDQNNDNDGLICDMQNQ